jgi:hydrogenase maturation factor
MCVRRILDAGKLPPELLRELLGEADPLPPEVELGPSLGEDACAIRVAAGVLVAATDPITLTSEGVGAWAVVINANDVAVTGVRPRWFLASVLLPEGTRVEQLRALFREMRAACARVGATLVGGHTEVTPAVRQTVVVGQMLGLAEDGRYVPTGGAEPGDVIVQVGEAPIEGAAVLATEAAARLGSLPADLVARAREAVGNPGISVVAPALLAAELGASALHDPTEGGLAAGLYELGEASGVALRVDVEAVLWFEPGRAVCAALGADPWGTLASGTLLAAFPPARAEAALAGLGRSGFAARRIGEAFEGDGVVRADGTPLPAFARDEVARVLGGA